MKKILTFAVALLASFSLWAAYPTATTTYALEDLTFTEATLTYEITGLSGDAQKLNKVLYIEVEVPCGLAQGNLYLRGTSSNTGRFATIWGNNGTERDESRKVAMKNGNSDSIPFTADDIAEVNGKYYIRFSSADNAGGYFDYKISGFSYVLAEECSSKTVVSTVESLTAVAINDYPIAAADFTTLATEHTLILEDSVYVTAPVVKFTKHTVITYDDESTKEKDEVIEKTSQQAQASMWGAMVDIAGVAYSVYTVKAASYTVTYKAGNQVLGTEVVAANGNPKEYAQYESLPLSTFEGWYKDAELTQAVASMAAEVISADVTYYAKLSKAYASSLNIEQLVLDEGKGAKIDSILIARGYAFENINELDSLNDEKPARNEPYLGLKLKTAGAFVACNIKAGDSIVVKFGNVGDDLKIGVNGDYRTLAKAEAVLLGYKATADSYMEIITTTKSTVVLKQIMINEDIAPVVLPGEGGGEETKDTDATIKSLTINGVAVEAVEGVYAYEVPADANLAQVEVVYELNSAKATADPASGFKVDVPAAGEAANTQLITVTAESGDKKEYTVSVTRASSEAIDNTDATIKAVKVIHNGQLVIIRDSKEFNVLGAQTK